MEVLRRRDMPIAFLAILTMTVIILTEAFTSASCVLHATASAPGEENSRHVINCQERTPKLLILMAVFLSILALAGVLNKVLDDSSLPLCDTVFDDAYLQRIDTEVQESIFLTTESHEKGVIMTDSFPIRSSSCAGNGKLAPSVVSRPSCTQYTNIHIEDEEPRSIVDTPANVASSSFIDPNSCTIFMV